MSIETEDPRHGLTAYEHRLHDEITRKGRQLALARQMLRMALKYGCAASRPPDYLTEGCARDTAASIRASLPKLDDRSAKKRRTR